MITLRNEMMRYNERYGIYNTLSKYTDRKYIKNKNKKGEIAENLLEITISDMFQQSSINGYYIRNVRLFNDSHVNVGEIDGVLITPSTMWLIESKFWEGAKTITNLGSIKTRGKNSDEGFIKTNRNKELLKDYLSTSIKVYEGIFMISFDRITDNRDVAAKINKPILNVNNLNKRICNSQVQYINHDLASMKAKLEQLREMNLIEYKEGLTCKI